MAGDLPSPDKLAYTYSQTAAQGGSQSRIDRIYAKDQINRFSKDWEISPSGIPTDHQLISVKISTARMPFVGKGRWTMPLFLITNKNCLEEIQKKGKSLEEALLNNKQSRTEDINPQTLFEQFKTEIIDICRNQARKSTPKIDKDIADSKKTLETLLNDNNLNTEEKKQSSIPMLENINKLEQMRHNRIRDNIAAKNKLEEESAASKQWASTGKAKKPRDTLLELRIPGSDPPKYESRSDKMAEIARNYHNDLQSQDIITPDIRNPIIEEVTNTLSAHLSIPHQNDLKALTSRDEIASVIHKLPNGKAPGINGIPYELWKTLLGKFESTKKDTEEDNNTPDIANILTEVYNDIEKHGVTKGSNFAEGWLCPLYKKNDKREIANYRPITLLNSDYKIFTKALSLKLAKAAPSVIHENQAGFIPGRSITEQIRLTQMIQSFSELDNDGGGAIIALDQEKAYDKIAHDYLWTTLQKLNFPQEFIRTVKSLYDSAETAVIINGEISSKYNVTRGVRQGDPLSCLIFDLAIEPLAEMLRKSELSGFQAPGSTTRVIVTLFADDTTVYLNKKDDFRTLLSILQKWCNAAGAKFNINKTEIIPIGPENYRRELINTRKINPDQDPICPNMSIAEEGTAKRILGAWIGNKTNEEGIWSPTFEKIHECLKRWEKTHPHNRGKKNNHPMDNSKHVPILSSSARYAQNSRGKTQQNRPLIHMGQ